MDKALEAANLQESTSPRQPMRLLKYRRGYASELLTRCKYFQVERVLLNTEVYRDLVDYKTEENSFHALLCVDGCGSIVWKNGSLNFFKGDCVFIPADSVEMKLHGRAQILDVSCYCKQIHEVRIVDGFVKYLGGRYTMYYCFESGPRNSYFIETKDGYFNPGRKFLKIAE